MLPDVRVKLLVTSWFSTVICKPVIQDKQKRPTSHNLISPCEHVGQHTTEQWCAQNYSTLSISVKQLAHGEEFLHFYTENLILMFKFLLTYFMTLYRIETLIC